MNSSGVKRLLGTGIFARPAISTSITTVGAGTLTAAAIVGGVINRSGPTAAFTDTATTATLILAAIKTQTGDVARVGQSWELRYINTTGFTATIASGTGVTVSGITTVPAFQTATYLVTYSAVGAFTMVGISQGAAAGTLPASTVETVTATNVITADETGKTFFLNSATEFVSTLPAPAAGLKFTFIVVGAPSGASYTVVGASGTPIHGMVLSKDLNGATDSGATAGTGVLTLTFVDGKSQKGDRADFVSDGTDWFVVAYTGGNFDAITLS